MGRGKVFEKRGPGGTPETGIICRTGKAFILPVGTVNTPPVAAVRQQLRADRRGNRCMCVRGCLWVTHSHNLPSGEATS